MSNQRQLDQILSRYFERSFKTLISEKNYLINSLVIIIRLIHFVGLIFLFLGFMFPQKFRDYHIIWCIKTLVLWHIFSGKCYLTVLVNYVKGNKDSEYEEFLPMSDDTSQSIVFFVLVISILSMLYPEYSPFNLLRDFINYLEYLN